MTLALLAKLFPHYDLVAPFSSSASDGLHTLILDFQVSIFFMMKTSCMYNLYFSLLFLYFSALKRRRKYWLRKQRLGQYDWQTELKNETRRSLFYFKRIVHIGRRIKVT
jgi:hypothetical protein